MTTTLSPLDAASLASRVYAVNSGDDLALKIFMSNKLFSGVATSKVVVKAETGGRIFRAARDGFGLCAKGTNGDIYLVFRGTTEANNKADFITDARIGIERSVTGLPVHIGFNYTFKSMLPEIRQFVADAGGGGTVHCIGHSLGGAVACLAADWASKTLKRSVKLYTFGQPRTGLTMYSLMFSQRVGAKNIHRTYHTTDPVPMVPVFPYVHSPLPGYGHSVRSMNPILSGDAHRMDLYLDNMSNVSNWSQLSSAPPMYTHEDAIEAWLRSNANSNPNCPKTFEWVENALIWLLKKQLGAITVGLQFVSMGIHTFADKVAWVLEKGIELGGKVSEYVNLFMRKVMRILGITFQKGVHNMTRAFFRFILETLTRRAYEMASRAIRSIRRR